jgi:hypothetical protein
MQANKSGIDDAFEVIGVAPAEIAVVDADRRDPGLFRLGNRDFGAAIDRDIADIVAAIDEGGNGRFMYDGNGNAGVSGPRLARDGEDARQPGEPVAAKRIVDQLVGDDAGVAPAVSDAAERRFTECPRVADAKPHGVRPVWIEVIGAVAHLATIMPCRRQRQKRAALTPKPRRPQAARMPQAQNAR